MKMSKNAWPVMIVSQELNLGNDNGVRLREIAAELEHVQECKVIPSFTYEDAWELFLSRADLGAVVVDWDLPFDDGEEHMTPDEFVHKMRERNKKIPILLMTDRLETENIPTGALGEINGCLWKNADTAEFIAGRIEIHLVEYIKSVFPVFFGELVKYAEEYKYAWHTPGHLGGQGFLRSPAGVAMYKFFGENTFRADLSISVPELGSLLDHEGVVGDAERNSARVFGADQTYYVLNGTSTVNQIVWRSQLVRDDIAFVDRNCHKSLNYAMVITEALPVYMVPRRNRRGIIGPVRLSEFSPESIHAKIQASKLVPDALKAHTVKMSALTNSTYDGVCYNVINIKSQLEKSVENLHFDEAVRLRPVQPDVQKPLRHGRRPGEAGRSADLLFAVHPQAADGVQSGVDAAYQGRRHRENQSGRIQRILHDARLHLPSVQYDRLPRRRNPDDGRSGRTPDARHHP